MKQSVIIQDHRADKSLSPRTQLSPHSSAIDKGLNSGLNVLLVDDNADMAFVSGMLLKFLGFQARVCHSGSECIELAKATRPDIILLDIEMPVMDGYAVCEHIRKQDWGRDLAIVAYTSLDEGYYKDRILAAGFDGYLGKPAADKALSAVIINTITSKTQRT